MKIVRCEWAGVEADAWVADASGTARGAAKCRVVVHAGAPRWLGGGEGEEETLRGCYRRAAEAARAAGCASVAFPLLGVRP